MKVVAQYAVCMAAGLLSLPLGLAASPQEAWPMIASEPGVSNPSAARIAATGTSESPARGVTGVTSGGATSKPGKAVGSGDPSLGGERHPLYRLSKSDVVEISFTFSPEFNQSVTIQPDGFLVLKAVGALPAEGSTIPELQQSITLAYSAFLNQPEITVSLKEFQKPYFLASGEVARPGKYELRGDLTVNEAVAIAGGFTQQARHSQVILFRRVSPDFAESHVIDLKKMLNARDLKEDWHLRPGDFVYVPQSRISKIRKFVPASSTNWYLNPLQF